MKKLKLILPMLAIVFAIGLAFATETTTTTTTTTTSSSQTAYYSHPIFGLQSIVIGNECHPDGNTNCKINNYQLYQEPSLATPLLRD